MQQVDDDVSDAREISVQAGRAGLLAERVFEDGS